MAEFVLIHGAGDVGWYWHLVERDLRARGHETVAPDLPCEDDSAGLSEYTETVVAAAGASSGLVVVGQSFGGFTAPLAATRLGARLIVLVAGMIPAPGEKPEDWPANTGLWEALRGQAQEHGDRDLRTTYYHDVPGALAEEAMRRARQQSDTPGCLPWPLAAWPAIETRVIACTQDRAFPAAFMRRVARERLGIVPDELAAGHCAALSSPAELAGLLDRYAAAAIPS